MRIFVTLAKGVLGCAALLGVTTMTEDFSAFLRRVADMLSGGEHVVFWVIGVTLIAWAAFDIFKWWREKHGGCGKQSRTEPTVDYGEAGAIINRYIDPDDSMKPGVRISVRSQILAKFENVVGAKVGDGYDGELLHRWLQKNGARALVNHQGEIV